MKRQDTGHSGFESKNLPLVQSDQPEGTPDPKQPFESKFKNLHALLNEPDPLPPPSVLRSTVASYSSGLGMQTSYPHMFAQPADNKKQERLNRFKKCFSEAVTAYETYVNGRWNIPGVTEYHGGTGLKRVSQLQTTINEAEDMEQVRSALIGYCKDNKTRLKNGSFFSFFLNALRNNSLVVNDFNELWFSKRFLAGDLKINDLQSEETQTVLLVIYGRKASLELENLNYTTDAAQDARDRAFKYFSEILLQDEQNDDLLELKALVGQAYLTYYNYMNQNQKSSTKSGHGDTGLERARTLADTLAHANNFKEALKPFIDFFPSSRFSLVKAGSKNHSFISYFLEELRKKPNVVGTLNREWFSVIQQSLELTSLNYFDDAANAERAKIVELFKRLYEVATKKAASEPSSGPKKVYFF
ncbi:MAG: hypothetical protein AB7F64_01740 [Gammaproteobacteria bacterium]